MNIHFLKTNKSLIGFAFFHFRQRLELMREMCQNEGAIEDTPTSPLANRAASSHAQLAQQDSTASVSYAGGDPFYDRFPWYV